MTREVLKVKGSQTLVRDVSSHAIINTSETDYLQYLSRRDASLKQKEQIQRQAEEIDCIKDDLNEIKNLLKTMLGNLQD